MTPEHITDMMRHAIMIAIEISAPMLVASMVVGLLISLFQTLTQIQEQTLSFVPKLLVFAGILAIFFPWMLKTMIRYTNYMWIDQWNNLVHLITYAQ